ncbi:MULTISPECIES: FAD-dependent oxidoreductase [Pseudonocardia]|uniref:Pentachlorophenol 4-monooxygenase n=2 Tax=Pseudonocardia TaxID=1847 RepID=A0A1Y2MVF9_PSEAH|nr:MULTISPECIES: FAD-dependent oxidoreductase [Pseudonocardia]OSY38959.1 Pentachlorophenol 4-monooxygenase [Pseudonocardia autotrophica]TDN76215.1 2-polyprenyl-6-methoxyphenol hydroxylase-like FAD-dependent oxidoreductase [Pseudonocardia autotrophica]BBG00197.1 FAD-dependent oxidoreductase [Pseudonocardia autotrophica]GEC26734.1 FAD-dependent oxidoreductase [Pseudonocardia saturnea]
MNGHDTPGPDADVVVVGAGPTGLLLAGDLAEAGVRVTVLERRTEASGLTRAFAVHARTLEQLDARGLADRLVALGTRLDEFRLFGRTTVDLTGLDSRFPFLLVVPQYQVELLLRERALAAGARLHHGTRVDGITQDDDGVTVSWSESGTTGTVQTGATGTVQSGATGTLRAGATDATQRGTVRARYLVGTDGHHSTVREALGLGFPGHAVARSLVLADVLMDSPPPDALTADGNADGFCFVVPYGDGWYRVIARDRRVEHPDAEPVTLDEIAGISRAVFGTDWGMRDPRWTSRFHSDERQVDRYRVGRVFLAGDAAHVHSPAGGQGMNTGLQDAANLGWKLATVLAGTAPEVLLDSYHAERHPVGRMVLRTSGGLIRAAMLRPRIARALRNRVVATVLGLPVLGRRVRETLTGIGIGYRRPRGAHRLVGTRAADVTGADGTRLYEALRGGHPVLVAPAPDRTRAAAPAAAPELPAIAEAPRIPRVRTLTVPDVEPYLVRPDGYIAWAGSDPSAALLTHPA